MAQSVRRNRFIERDADHESGFSDGGLGMSLGKPLRAAGLANPDGQRVVVEGPGFGCGVGVACKAAQDVIGGKSRVWREDADLKIAEFVGG